jgi:hypothetical protein
MRALALAAVLLLALMPSVARLLAARTDGGAHSGWVELCTLAGLKLVKLDTAAATPGSGGQSGHGHGLDGDCDYCPLLHSLAAPDAGPALALAQVPNSLAPALRAPQHQPAAPNNGLGSRGPPLS